jgi:hypothetical protein
MNIPGFTAEASLYRAKGTSHFARAAPGSFTQVLPQLGIGIGGGGIGVTYPPGDDDCYCCTSWVLCPCGLSVA